MPYLKDLSRRASLSVALGGDGTMEPEDGADLNFIICDLVDRFIEKHGLSYHTLEEIDGALDLARAEFQRRIVAPYEDIKNAENSDVFLHTAPILRQMAEALTATGLPTTALEIADRL